VPRPPSELFRERQAPEYFLSWFANILLMLYFNWYITFRSCLRLLLHYTLFTLFYHILVNLVSTVKKCLACLEVGWFPVTCELYVITWICLSKYVIIK
jgi:hypothetical protein